MSETEHYVFLLVEGFSHLAFSCAVEPLRIANLVSGKPLYHWSYISENGDTATSSNDSVTLVHGGLEPLNKVDILFVLSGLNVWEHITPGLLSFIRRERAHGIKIGALCSGAFVLAKAGLLDGVPTALHWEYHDSFMEEFPEVSLCRNVFVSDAKYITASGGTATADLMLHLIEKNHGSDLAVAVADQMVYNAVREATAEQRVSLQSRHGIRNPNLVRAIQIIADSIEDPVSPSVIADEVGISTRQLERLFGRYLNCSPAKYFLDMRLHKAQNLLLQTEQSVTEISLSCGFKTQAHFARVFRAQFGNTPLMHRTKII
ncbi:GlxA family transcriptional regulator [Pseudohalocynthiibacter sp. F2068]|jgi:AraC family transcriptional regulator, glycine betaine-responsive activator|uniref:GlxA family transcriptional regulator n=1 Tax=Pseudohalocynthiibacter sp. F2068 TaxID=2926418 RepID=UPI001FF61F85|nr:GlxA family transcriptional regulator [Pseudohalocynthiibacter sp. F2068]MCK0101448.1 GlxA family transcriptional regulator [Pseudohalocynthiibacter sp. F2068]